MAQLIYRGVHHAGTTAFRPRVPMNLIYRGQPHDGMAAAPVIPQMQMRYRGVTYSIGTAQPRASAKPVHRAHRTMARTALAEVA